MVPAADLAGVSTTRLYLVGFMGSGKTTVGRRLADRLGWDFVDMDAQIEQRYEETVTETFERHGEPVFRDRETEVLRSIARRDPPLVVATGGGVPLRPENRKIMEQTGRPVLLKVDPETAYERIQGDEDRPKLGDFRSFKELWEHRQDAYNSIPWSVNANQDRPEDVVGEILEQLSGSAS